MHPLEQLLQILGSHNPTALEQALRVCRKLRIALHTMVISENSEAEAFEKVVTYLLEKPKPEGSETKSFFLQTAEGAISNENLVFALGCVLVDMLPSIERAGPVFRVIDRHTKSFVYFAPKFHGARRLKDVELFEWLSESSEFRKLSALETMQECIQSQGEHIRMLPVQEAIRLYDQWIEMNPSDLQARLFRGTLYLEARKLNFAMQDFDFYARVTDPSHWSDQFRRLYNSLSI